MVVPEEKKKKMGRTLVTIDWKRVDELLEAGCLGTEIAAYFGVCAETLYDRTVKETGFSFSDYSAQKKAKGDSMIREAQFKKALKRLDNTMLVWLGKQRLGQRENPGELEVTKETNDRYLEVINQLTALQTSRRKETSSASNEEKSA